MTARVVLCLLAAFTSLFASSGALAAPEHDAQGPGLGSSAGSCPAYRLLRSDDEGTVCWSHGLQLAALEAAPGGEASTDQSVPPAEAREPRWILAGLVAFAEVAVTAGKATITFEHTSFNVKNEGWFGTNTEFGGADKASHFVDYYVITKEFAFIFRQLGFSENAARWMAAGTAFAGGLTNEVADGFTKYGFSYGDLVMNSLGIATALVVTGAHVDDVVGFRTSHFGSYKHDVYSMDLNLAGLARRLKVDIGPLRFLYFSATYGVKGYPTDNIAERQRQIGLELGLNLEEILNTFGVRRDTWWGTGLHLVADNIRFPFTAGGFRYDLNHRKWHGPNTGNFP
jgi:Predicted periplasmic lipoprotein (DUF2279)